MTTGYQKSMNKTGSKNVLFFKFKLKISTSLYFLAYEWPLRVCSIFKIKVPTDSSTYLGKLTVKCVVLNSECRFSVYRKQVFQVQLVTWWLFFNQIWLINLTCREWPSKWDYLYLISNHFIADPVKL